MNIKRAKKSMRLALYTMHFKKKQSKRTAFLTKNVYMRFLMSSAILCVKKKKGGFLSMFRRQMLLC